MVELNYNVWPIARQLRLSQIVFSIILTITIILITRYQILWLEDRFLLDYKSMLKSDLQSQIEELAKVEKNFIEQEFSNYIQFVENLQKIDSLILGFSGSIPIIAGKPVQHTKYGPDDYDYTTGSFMSRFVLSAAGIELEKKHAGMDQIYRLLREPKFLFIYSGFEVDEIIHYYPGGFMSLPTYTPLTREWYYRAKDKLGEVVITEPYLDASTGDLIVTLSKAIKDTNQNFYGVSACDITLSYLRSAISTTKVMEKGFIMLISIGGMVLTVPEQWNIPKSSALIIFETDQTGISESLWNNITSSKDGTLFEFSRNQSEYILLKFEINTKNNEVSHYLIICADKQEVLNPSSNITQSLTNTNYLIFFLVVGIEIFLFSIVSIALQILSIKLSHKLKCVRNVFSYISKRALVPNITKGVQFKEIQENRKGIESIVKAVRIKVLKTMEREQSFEYFNWETTRPQDSFWYSEWVSKLYPFNFWTGKIMPWRLELSKIQTENLNLFESLRPIK